MEQVGDDKPTASQRIRQARAQRRFTLMGLSGPSLWLPLGIVAALLLLGGFAVFSNSQRRPPLVVATATATLPPATPTGFGDPTATSAIAATVPVPPSNVIAVGGWVQVTGAGTGLTVRSEPSTSGRRLTALAEGTKAHVIGGPETANGFTWWQVDNFSKTDPELEGWCAETFLTPTTAP